MQDDTPCPAPPAAGQPQTLAPGLVRVLAPNPSPMTHWGTNSFLLGQERLAVIDPGPAEPAHLQALLAAIDGRRVTHILVTHSHLDHSPLARPLAEATGAPVCAFGAHDAGRRPVMAALAAAGGIGGGEGADAAFGPDIALPDGTVIETGAGPVTALHLPGHIANHMGFCWNGVLFPGDHVMGWASSLVSPPDGDLRAFLESCERLLARPETVYHPAHGATVEDGPERVRWLIAHRKSRSAQLRAALGPAPCDLETLTARIYTDIDRALLPAAARNLLAHLIFLIEEGEVQADPAPRLDAQFSRTR